MTDAEITVRRGDADRHSEMWADARTGLTDRPKWLSPKWFYDAVGSELFERITELPEYYPTRAESQILRRHADQIAEETKSATLVELGSGSSEKTRLILDAMRTGGWLRSFVPLDVSEPALRAAASAIASDFPGLHVHGIVDDFAHGQFALPSGDGRMIALLGGTVGNLLPGERAEFLSALRATLCSGEWLLLGTDLVKDARRLLRAYSDSQGVTAEFNRNVLNVLNRELGAKFQPGLFQHVARWDPVREWIEMRLRATREMSVPVPALGTVRFAAGEEIRTEVSAKFRPAGVRSELDAAGFELCHWWTDDAGDFAVSLAQAKPGPGGTSATMSR